MLKISIITSYRFLSKSKTYTIINLLGLVLGLTAVFILFTFLINELSFNSSFRASDLTYRMLTQDRKRGTLDALTAMIVAPALSSNINSIEVACRIANPAGITGPVAVYKRDIFYRESGLICADPSITDIFSIPLLRGTNRPLLSHPASLLISESAAERYFGRIDPVGKTMKIRTAGKIFYFVVEAVFQDLPWNSSYQADFIASNLFLHKIIGEISDSPAKFDTSFSELLVETIVRLRPGISPETAEKEIRINNQFRRLSDIGYNIKLQGIRDMYLGSGNIQNDFLPKGNPSNLVIYSSLAVFILLLAAINYSILSTARSALRFKEIGVKKVLGASRKALRNQILTESVLLTFLAFPLAFLLLGLISPLIKLLYGYELQMYASNIALYFILFATITLLIGFLSGTYVALYLSSLDPLHALKLRLFSYRKFSFGKVFTVFQLFITLSLLISFITVYRQMRFCFHQENKFRTDNILMVVFDPGEFSGYEHLKERVRNIANVSSVSGISISFPSNATNDIRLKIGTSPVREVVFEHYYVDYDFFSTLGIPFESGGDFERDDSAARKSGIIINSTGKNLLSQSLGNNDMIGNWRIHGVVSDFNMGTLHSKIKPSMFRIRPARCKSLVVRYNQGQKEQVIANIEKEWRKLAIDQPFNYLEYNKELEVLYKKDENFQNIVASFTFLAFLITGMGLFGLAILLSERKIREVAIRKVFGASNINIVYEMQKDFYFYIIVAAALSIPVSWYFMDRWLNTFYYHEGVSPVVILGSVLSVTLFVSLILLQRTRKVLRNNPLIALKYE